MNSFDKLVVVKKEQKECCDLRRAAQILGVSMVSIRHQLELRGRYENEIWKVCCEPGHNEAGGS